MAGIPIVTDKQFWRDDTSWTANYQFLLEQRALFVEGVDVFAVRQTLCHGHPPFNENFPDIGLVVVGGFYPHYRQSSVVQALTHQLPQCDILMLYASRDAPPQFQDRNLIHVQTWTADADNGYVVRAGSEGVGGHSRCFSAESRFRGLASDPTLVKVSAFVHTLETLKLVGTSISPSATVRSMLLSNRSVLFCGEGDAALARCCLTPLHLHGPVPLDRAYQIEGPTPCRFTLGWRSLETYATLQQRAADEQVPPEEAADAWANAWPTGMTSHDFTGMTSGSSLLQRDMKEPIGGQST